MRCFLALLLVGALSWTGAFVEPKLKSWVTQPLELSGPLHGSVTIPFRFSFPWELDQKPNIRISWTKTHTFGEEIYSSNSPPHPYFQGRIFLHWKSGEQNGSLLIQDLRKGDALMYYCTVWAATKLYGVKSISSLHGTWLEVTEGDWSHPNSGDPPGPASNSLTSLIVILCFCLIHKIGICVILEMSVLPKV
ncbi:paired immunoglobulin-like type 2 receptor beta [Gracilinanus agilis]|uniref:paired immunoglobulin-like type 2 receptor beta n=1 Tax=Gracilinanus agilis TaxID=191870 RepID=UPI001CFE1BDB|nr:paired immunoglobulin-like type 2 receptor beta [Gracilinanus agilis]